MSAILLALASACSYGVSDYLSGVASRRAHYAKVALVVQAVMTATTIAVVWLMPGVSTPAAIGWGALAGVGSSMGTALLYRGLGSGQMNVVAPLSAATAALVPVVAGLVAGERPSLMVLVGVMVLIPAIWLISSGEPGDQTHQRLVEGALDGLLAGVGFALSFIALDQAPSDGGLWPAAYAQLSALVVITVAVPVLMRGGREHDGLSRRSLIAAAVAGVLGASAVASFLVATNSGLLVVVSVLTSLYPAVTVILAAVLLKERTRPVQLIGLALAASGVVLVALG